MNFLELHERLRLETWRRIDQGILSSSLLARRTGLAQAHISNFLHRRRRLSLTALNSVLLAQELDVEDLSPSLRNQPPLGIDSRPRPLTSSPSSRRVPLCFLP